MCILILFVFSNAQEKSRTTSKLHITIKNLKNDTGKLILLLIDNKDDFEIDSKSNFLQAHCFRRSLSGINNKEAVIVINSVPFGTYTVKFIHDENENGKLGFNAFHIPTERYGFSNDTHNN